MRSVVLLLALLQLAPPPHPSTRVTVAQLEDFLTSRRAAKESDSELAEALMRVQLSQELTPATLSRIAEKTNLRPQTAEQINLLAAESIFEAPPPSEWVDAPAPDALAQQRMLSVARSYAATALHHLPDFLAIRTTTGYDNAPRPVGTKSPLFVVRMHFVRQHRREVTYRNGAEVTEIQNPAGRSATAAADGFSTHGEFGPTLSMVLDGSANGTVSWSRWQRSPSGARLAVFHYSVPRAASEYRLDLCCFPTSVDDSVGVSFRDKPAFHGEIFVHPDSGVVERVTVEAELPNGTPVRRCSIAVEYGPVKIDAKSYICPVRGVAVLVFSSPLMTKIDGIGLEKHINQVQFDRYHKFGSTSRIINAD
jgi:hypothetical protein